MTTQQRFEEGQHFSAAVICEKVLQERNGDKPQLQNKFTIIT
ncbi:hypothetical protein ES703_65307 [subsurface metagenome]